MFDTCAIILSSGGMSPDGGFERLFRRLNGRPVISQTLSHVSSMTFAKRIFVAVPELAQAVEIPDNVQVLHSPCPWLGASMDIRLGLAAACGTRYMFFSGHEPYVSNGLTQLLFEVPQGYFAVPVHEGKHYSPVICPATYRDELLALRGDEGISTVYERHADHCIFIETGGRLPVLDVALINPK